jgi:gliding motility-associated-like protein
MKEIRLLFFLLTLINNVFATDYFWVGNSGEWSEQSNWATTSGGNVKHLQIPTPLDNVIFDQNSFSQFNCIVNINVSNAVCKNFEWKNQTKRPILQSSSSSYNIRIYGSLDLSTNIQFKYEGAFIFESTKSGNQIKSGNHIIKYIEFKGINGEWILQDSLKLEFNDYGAGLNLTAGVLNTNNQTIVSTTFQSNGNYNRKLILGNSKMIIGNCPNYPWNWVTSGFNFQIPKNASTILLTSIDRILFSHRIGSNFSYFNRLVFQTTNKFQSDIAYISDSNEIKYMEFNNPVEIAELNGCIVIRAVYKKVVSNINNRDCKSQNALFLDDANFSGNAVFDTLVLSPSHDYKFEAGQTQIILKTWVLNGSCNSPIRIRSSEPGVKTTLIKSSGTVNGVSLIIQDVYVSGGAKFNANHSYDLSNNNGWIIGNASKRNLYYTGKNNIWNDPKNWSTISGGNAEFCIPSPVDDVIFDDNSFGSPNDSLKIQSKYNRCHNMIWMNTVKPVHIYSLESASLEIFGNIEMNGNINNEMQGYLYFDSPDSGNTIASNKFKFNGVQFVNKGSWTLVDSMHVQRNSIVLSAGTLNSNGKIIRARRFISASRFFKNLIIKNSQVIIYKSLEPSWQVSGNKFNLDAKNSDIQIWRLDGPKIFGHYSEYPKVRYHNIRLMDLPYSDRILDDLRIHEQDSIDFLFCKNQMNFIVIDKNIIGEMLCVGSVKNQFSRKTIFRKATYLSDAKIEGEGVFDTLVFSAGANIKLDTLVTQLVQKELIAEGDCVNGLITIESIQLGRAALLDVRKKNVTLNNVSLRDIHCSGASNYKATNALNLGNNMGWNFFIQSSRTFYWVSDSGSWSDTFHWSFSSGGNPCGCIPTALDNVIIDANSFTQDKMYLNLDKSSAFCNDFICEMKTPHFSITGTDKNRLRIYGSLFLEPQVDMKFLGILEFNASDSDNFIRTSFKPLNRILFSGTGLWRIIDSIYVTEELSINSGTILTNGNYLRTRRLFSEGSYFRRLDLDSSCVDIIDPPDYGWWVRGENFVINAAKSRISLSRKDWRKCFFHSLSNPNTSFNIIEFKEKCSNIGGTDYFFCSPGNSINYLRFESQIEELKINECNVGKLLCYEKVKNQYATGSSIRSATYLNECNYYGNQSFDSLILTAGGIYKFESTRKFKVQKLLHAIGNPCFAMTIQSTEPNSADTLEFVNSDIVFIDYAELRDQFCKCPKKITVGSFSIDVSGNYNWIFTNFPSKSYGLGMDTILCLGSKLKLTTEKFGNAISYNWNDGTIKDHLYVDSPGIYWVKVTFVYRSDTCWVMDTINVSYSDVPILADFEILRKKPGKCLNVMDFTANFTDKSQYAVNGIWNWDDGTYSNYDQGVSAVHDFDGSKADYSVELLVKNKFGCADSIVKQLCYSDTIFCLIPNVFTPNNDQMNDYLDISILGNTEASVMIYNRWGEMVFYTDDIRDRWNGTYMNRLCPEGIYVVLITVKNKTYSNRQIKSSVFLVRPN